MSIVLNCLNIYAYSVLFSGSPEPFSSNGQLEDSDEVLALQLQEELDREAVRAQTVDLMDGGLFFCHICSKDLTHMTPEGRTHHVNRCAPHLLCLHQGPDS